MTADPSPPAVAGPSEPPASFTNLPRTQLLGTLLGLGLALLLSALDQTIVGTAMPRIVAELHGFEHYAGVTTAYLLASTAVVPIVGKLSDLYGRKPFFLGGVLVFLAASALCGASQDMFQLIAFRGLQGLGAGILSAMAFIVVGDLFPPAQRGRIQGLFGAVFGVASVIGPILGGYLTDNLSWRWVFYVNLPVGLLALLALVVLFPHVRPSRQTRSIDYLGAATLVLAIVPILLALSWGGHEYAWDSAAVVGPLLFGLAMTAVFIWREGRAAEPVIPLELFKSSIVSISVLASGLVFMAMFGTVLFIPLFLQAVIGTSPTVSGTILTPMTIAMIVGSAGAGWFISRTGGYRLTAVVGLGFATLGMFLLSTMTTDTGLGAVVANTLVLGLGLGATMPIFTLVVQNAVPHANMGSATALTQLARSMGGTLGAAIFGSLLVNAYSPAFRAALLPGVAAALPPDLLGQAANPQALLNPSGLSALQVSFAQLGPHGPELLAQAMEAIRVALASSIHLMFLCGTAIVAVAWVLVFFLREIPLRRSHQPAPGTPVASAATSPESNGVTPAKSDLGEPVLAERGRPGQS